MSEVRGTPTERDGGAGGAEALLTIGQVVSLLQPEFPDLSISKVRYLEDRGLLLPKRTSGGYRKYANADVRRLHRVLTLQRDEFLPLHVIKQKLDDHDVLGSRSLAQGTAFRSTPGPEGTEQTYSFQEAAAETGLSADFLHRLAEYRLVGSGPSRAPGLLGDTDLEIARLAAQLARHGLEPRNLRLVRSSAEREVAMLGTLLAPALRSSRAERREEAERLLKELGSLLSRLLDLLLYQELQALLP